MAWTMILRICDIMKKHINKLRRQLNTGIKVALISEMMIWKPWNLHYQMPFSAGYKKPKYDMHIASNYPKAEVKGGEDLGKAKEVGK